MKPWVKTGLFSAVSMFVFMTFISPYIFVWIGLQDEDEPKFPLRKIIISIVVWTIFGFYMGYKSKNKYKPKKQIDS
jgi:hypothetical protein